MENTFFITWFSAIPSLTYYTAICSCVLHIPPFRTRRAGWRSSTPHSSPLDTPAGTHWSLALVGCTNSAVSRSARGGWNVAAHLRAGRGRCGRAFHDEPLIHNVKMSEMSCQQATIKNIINLLKQFFCLFFMFGFIYFLLICNNMIGKI